MTPASKPVGFGPILLLILLGAAVGGALTLWFLNGALGAGFRGASVGWALAGVLAVLGWFSGRLAVRAEKGGFVKVVMLGMLLRLLLAGIGAGVVIGATSLEPAGFVLGLLAGVMVFQTVEVASLAAAVRVPRAVPAPEVPPPSQERA